MRFCILKLLFAGITLLIGVTSSVAYGGVCPLGSAKKMIYCQAGRKIAKNIFNENFHSSCDRRVLKRFRERIRAEGETIFAREKKRKHKSMITGLYNQTGKIFSECKANRDASSINAVEPVNEKDSEVTLSSN